MKREYTKPFVVFENFALSTYIAACQNEVSHEDGIIGGCKAYYDDQFGDALFSSTIPGCVFTPSEVGNDKLCYDVPTVSLNMFAS